MRNFRCVPLCGIYRYVSKRRIIFSLCALRHQSFLSTGLQLQVPKRLFSNLPSSVAKVEFDGGRKQIVEEFPDPKNIFQNVITEAFLVNQSFDLNPDLSFKQVSGRAGQGRWKATLSLMWPLKFTVEATAAKKAEAEKLVYSMACKKFKEFGVLDSENLPVLPKSQLTVDGIELKESKGKLSNIYQVLWPRLGNRDLFPMYNTSEVKGLFGNKYWKSELRLKYPAAVSFEGVGKRMHFAECVAAAKALHWLYEKGVINKKLKPILFSKEEEKEMLDNQKAPYPVIIPCNLQVEMKETLEHFKGLEAHFEEVNKSGIEECFQSAKVSVLCDDFSGAENENDHVDCLESAADQSFPEWDIITEKPLREFSAEELRSRNQAMYDKYTEWQTQNDPKALKILDDQKELPIFKQKDKILKLLSENQVLVLSGETGSGKTTQVPQYILDSYIREMKGSDCNIIVTQPRRISAISIAARIAAERGEKVGETVGHQVRFDKNLPKEKGALLFCSTGILLRKLCLNPNLDGVSHIIVDEVHERNVQIDFLLILLKKLLRTNKNIKVILMSATFNFEIFSQYFDGCPVIKVPGFIYPVKQLFVDDITNAVGHQNDDFLEPKLNVELFASAIKHIHKTQPPGAILCFLPGWNEIKDVTNKLHSELESDGSDYVIYPAHSRLSHDKQKRIFNRLPNGIRKIILATNIAETSITINDVVYVVDSGFQKGTSFCAHKGTAALGTQWISKANVLQRKGRAGRVKPGVCYHLYPKEVFDSMEDYPTPEILRMPLENVILDCKLYCPDMTAEDFLSLAVQPPIRDAIQHGVKELQMLEILDENENLTVLGKSIVNFTSHPRLSKALVLGSFMRCLDPVLTICAFLTLSRDAFINSLEDKEEIRKIKEDHDFGMYSDHLALYNMYSLWPGSRSEKETSDFAAEQKLDEDSLIFVRRLKELFAEHLFEVGLIDDQYSFMKPEAKCNENSSNMNIVYSALCSAFYPNIIKLTQGEKRKGRLRKEAVICSTVRGLRAHISKESVAYQQHQLTSPWLIYFSALQSDARMALLPQDVSLVPGMCLLLFAGRHLCIICNEVHQDNGDREPGVVTLKVDDFTKLSFCCSPSEGELLKDWRTCVRQILHLHLACPERSSSWLSLFHEKYIPTLKKVLCTDQAPFIQGKKFCLEDNRLIAEDVD